MPTIKEIKTILDSREHTKFIGLDEDLHFEAKSQPYDLDTPKDRYELAKDICGFCNSDGGYIIIGLEHEKSATRQIDIVSGLKLIRISSLEKSKYIGITKEYIYPKINTIECEWIESNNCSGLGVAYIYIPTQPDKNKPFLIKNVFDKELLGNIVFGISQRVGESCRPLTIDQLQTFIKRGKSEINESLIRIEQKVDLLLEGERSNVSPEKLLGQRINEMM